MKLLLCILAIFFPPLPVALLKGLGEQFIVSVVLTLLAYFPGLIHALWVTLSHDNA